ncbi:MAG: hypothetical protein M1816_007878 [Peltula sp. TS41687]|nr:MAG: hypothetical protein M1816_007878 [Peltula sp. TS41687]
MTDNQSSPDQVKRSGIPVVDLAKSSEDGSFEQRMSTAKQLVDACRQVGFVYVVNHGVAPGLVAEAFNWSKKLFDLNHEDKMKAPHPDGPGVHRGYSYPGLEKVSQVTADGGVAREEIHKQLRQVSDCIDARAAVIQESYEIGSEHNSDQPNIWLPEEILPGFRTFMTDFYWECHEASRRILEVLALGIGVSDDRLLRFHTGLNNQLRLLHYPSMPAEALESETTARMPAHSDWSSLTMLFQDDIGGLEVEDVHKPGTFIPARPLKDALIMNVGDLLMRWSNDFLTSTLHRVTLPPIETSVSGPERLVRERYSIPYFVAPDPDLVIECLPTCVDTGNPAKYEPITQRDYASMRAAYHYETKAPQTKPTAAAAG